jgi:hypothetical protein
MLQEGHQEFWGVLMWTATSGPDHDGNTQAPYHCAGAKEGYIYIYFFLSKNPLKE